jgi:phage terminase large subunit-like protein
MHGYARGGAVKAGPKRQVMAAPLDLSHLPRNGEKRVSAFSEEFLYIPQGKGARKPVRLRPWQKQIVRGLVPARGNRPRQGVLTMGRGNGKSGLAAILAAYFLFADEVEGAEVLCVATDERQARIVFNRVRRMIELNPRLEEQVQVFQDRIYVPSTDSALFPLPSVVDALQGYSPTFAIVDELHYVKEDVWEAMALASGKREHSLVLGISTPGDNRDSILYRLCEYGRSNPADKSFFFREYAASLDADLHDEKAWKEANPALGDFLSADAIRLDARTAREDNFRRYRLGQWVNGASAWLPRDEWDKCADTSVKVNSKTPVVLAFDGSISDDSTALTGCTVPSDGSKPHVFVLNVWAKEEPGWTVDRDEVDAAVKDAFKRYNVVEMVADPYGWRTEIQRWAKRYGAARVVEFPSYVLSRMAPFTDSLTTAIKQQTMTHDGNAVLAQHVANARAKSTVYGDVIVKDRKGSPRKIDAAVTTVMAYGVRIGTRQIRRRSEG